jgi:hypothetical protein
MGDLIKVNNNYDYLLELKLWTLTQERIEDLIAKMKSMELNLETIKKTTTSQMWTSELDLLV